MARSVSLIHRVVEGMVAARERQARSAVAPHLLALDDDALGALGHDRRTIEGWVGRPSSFR